MSLPVFTGIYAALKESRIGGQCCATILTDLLNAKYILRTEPACFYGFVVCFGFGKCYYGLGVFKGLRSWYRVKQVLLQIPRMTPYIAMLTPILAAELLLL